MCVYCKNYCIRPGTERHTANAARPGKAPIPLVVVPCGTRRDEQARTVKPPRKLWGFDSLPAHQPRFRVRNRPEMGRRVQTPWCRYGCSVLHSCCSRSCEARGTITWMSGIRLPPIPALSQREVLAWIDELIREVATGANRARENPWLERYLEAMWARLDGRPEPAWDSLDRRMIGHILSPGDFTSLGDYLAAVKRRVESPAEGWPPHVELPRPAWGMIGMALRTAPLLRIGRP